MLCVPMLGNELKSSMSKTRTYSELRRLLTFEDRFEYLKLNAAVGRSTFGFDRYINQSFYRSYEWKRARNHVINRDMGCDLGIPGLEIHADILIHHMNPMDVNDVIHGEDWIIDPEYLVTTCLRTHNAIHYGIEHLYPKVVTARQRGDTQLW